MNYEERELLLTDLCARLPYKVKVVDDMGRVCTLTLGNVDLCSMFYGEDFDQGNSPSICKPYLRPMSSITEEEKSYVQQCIDIVEAENYGDSYSPAAWDAMSDFTNYCYERHLDLHGLIPKGLALEAPEDMYNSIKTK